MRLFDNEISRSELRRRVGNLAQIGGVELLSHEQGYARGSRFLDFRTGSGFRFTVHVDRGMDPGFAEFAGANLAWLPPKLFAAPAYWENDDHAWVRYAMGGLCNTAGLVTIGSPQDVDVSSFKFHARAQDRFGTHDRIAMIPASHFNFGEDWQGERCILWAEGTVRQEIVYGENLLLTRRYEAELGGRSFTIRDVVRNDGFYPTPHQILYHFNIGYPVVDDGAELLAAVTGDVPGSIFDDDTGASERYRHFSGPEKEFFAEGYEIPMAKGPGWAVGGGGRQSGLQGHRRRARGVSALRPEDAARLSRVAHDGREPLRRRHGASLERLRHGCGPHRGGPSDHAGARRGAPLRHRVRRASGRRGDRRVRSLASGGREAARLMAAVAIPSIGVAMEEALLVKWHKQPGDDVAANEPVAEIETDKATMDLESPVAGLLGQHLFEEGAIVPVGTVIVEVVAEGDAVAPAPPAAAHPQLAGDAGCGSRSGTRGGRRRAARRRRCAAARC